MSGTECCTDYRDKDYTDMIFMCNSFDNDLMSSAVRNKKHKQKEFYFSYLLSLCE